MSKAVLMVAASGLARETLAVIRATGELCAIGMLDDNVHLRGSLVAGVEVVGGLDSAARYPDAHLVICAGSGAVRSSIVRRLEAVGVGSDRYATVLHPSVSLPSGCCVGPGTILLANVALTANVTIGSHVVG